MYGMVNKAMEEMVVARFGEATWERIREAAGVEVEVFISNEAYGDDLTYRLVGAAHEVLGMPAAEILRLFGAHWVETAHRDYDHLMRVGGHTLAEFLVNLPNFHTRVVLLFPELRPPNFRCTDVSPTSLRLHYHSSREGLAPFVEGLMVGLGARFGTPVRVRQLVAKGGAADHDEFHVDWAPAA